MNRIKVALAEKNMTQRDLARKIDVAEVTISRYVHDHRVPNSNQLVMIADTLDVSTDYLLGRTDKMEVNR